MKDVIRQQLRKIEVEHNVKIIYACEAGSRATGLETISSDYDVRFLYIHPIKWYLSIEKKNDVISKPIYEQLDLHGWDLHKALFLFKKSNPTLLEWLHSPHIYQINEEILLKIKESIPVVFSAKACFYHYLKMASGNFQEVLQQLNTSVKQYLNVVRPLLICLWLEKNKSYPPIQFHTLVHGCHPYIKEDLNNLALLKKGHTATVNFSTITTFIEIELDRLSTVTKTMLEHKDKGSAPLDEIFTLALENMWGIKL
ncbi:nucleotidyltransferase domain-containing protein [Anaerobacillus isosaccharinicus]|uniref:Nucleotidyltransferase domain-containing protein n=1 Tax=Anaerobacillus isosaccharinicus TaxID=1532552 RepID=A0A1S2KX88_9BACI|nr:nucleotidyltransferase domain-containing protein [Anaerobacillus isosaccharinicus]MBA5586792.1 nucleotidyltransferase domain-containing protein [Anaerobacillus isosaccharinicus]QOY34992.1 nucleotidyltransferase domain-containing protein [Anaerobacillus isosaccharinicus]